MCPEVTPRYQGAESKHIKSLNVQVPIARVAQPLEYYMTFSNLSNQLLALEIHIGSCVEQSYGRLIWNTEKPIWYTSSMKAKKEKKNNNKESKIKRKLYT